MVVESPEPSEPSVRTPPRPRAPNPIVGVEDTAENKLSKAVAKRDAVTSLRSELGRQVGHKAERLQREELMLAREKQYMDHSVEMQERNARADRQAVRQYHLDELMATQQDAENRKRQAKALKEAEALHMRQSVAAIADRDKSRENRDYALRRQQAANNLQEVSYQMYKKSVASPEQARLLAEMARLDRDEVDKNNADYLYERTREDDRERQRHRVARTQVRQVEERRHAPKVQAAEKQLEKELVNAQVTKATVAEMRKQRAAKARGARAQQDLAAAIAEKVARCQGDGSKFGPALATMHSSPELSHEVGAARFLEKPMGRPVAPPVPRPAPPGGGSASTPDLKAKSGPAATGLEPIGAKWSHGLSPQAKKAALEAARQREAAALLRRRDW